MSTALECIAHFVPRSLRLSAGAASLALVLAAFGTSPAAATDLHGAGSTFVQPLIASWTTDWSAKTGVKVIYDGGGSGAGVTKIKTGEVDFGATDAPLSDEELDANGLVQFPVVAGGIVVVESIAGMGAKRIQLTGDAIADIFAGRIKTWNDPKLKALNPTAPLPAAPINVVHRSDSSGITYNFSAYLAKVSPAWSKELGVGKTVKWPVGSGVEGNGNVGSGVMNAPNSIGYVEYGFAMKHDLRIISMRGASGKAVMPTQRSIQSAVASADWAAAKHFNLMLVDSQGNDAWPIAAVTWVVVKRDQSRGQTGKRTLDYFRWALHYGNSAADALGYTPLPDNVVKLIEAAWAKEIQD